MPLTPGAPLPRAFAIAARLLLDPMFWGRRMLDLLRPGMLIAATLVAGILVTLRSGEFGGLAMTATLFAALAWFSVPLLAHCWAPPVAREAAQALDIDASQGEDRSLLTFCWWWAMVTLLVAVPYIVGHELSVRIGWMEWLFVAVGVLAIWLVGGFCIRACLAGVVSRERLHETLVSIGTKQRLAWTAVLVVLSVAIEYAVSGMAWTWSIGMMLGAAAIGLAWVLLVATLSAAWSVQFMLPERVSTVTDTVTAVMTRPQLQQHRAVVPSRPVEARSFPWPWVLVVAVLAGGAVAWMNRLALLAQYLQLRHPMAFQAAPAGPASVHRRLHAAQVHFACEGDVGQLRLLERVGYGTEGPFQLRDALHCAARHGRTEAVQYLLARGAPADKARDPASRDARYRPQTPLQWAVQGRHTATVQALLAARVDVNQRTAAPTALALAAHAGNWSLYKRLRAAGARPDAAPDLPVVFAWADGRSESGTTWPDQWRTQLAAAEAAGLPIEARDAQGRNLLHWAANRGQIGLVEALLERGFSAAEPDGQGAAPYAHLLLTLAPQSTPTPQLRKVLAALLAGQDLARPVAGSGPFTRNQVTGWLAFPQGWSAESAVVSTAWLHAMLVAGPPAPDAPPAATGGPAPGAAGTVLPVSAGPRR